jgi:hypothetical protein
MNVSYRRAIPAAERDRREQERVNAPRIAERFPKVGRFAIAMTFRDPANASQPSPMRHIFAPSMQAHFEVRCPVRDCVNGGFELTPTIGAMLSRRTESRTAHASCSGSRGRVTGACGIELTYTLTMLEAD